MLPSERNEAFLHALSDRNRMKKMSSNKSKADETNEYRERGFVTHFSGANQDKVIKENMTKRPPKVVQNEIGLTIAPTVISPEHVVSQSDGQQRARKGWGLGTKISRSSKGIDNLDNNSHGNAYINTQNHDEDKNERILDRRETRLDDDQSDRDSVSGYEDDFEVEEEVEDGEGGEGGDERETSLGDLSRNPLDRGSAYDEHFRRPEAYTAQGYGGGDMEGGGEVEEELETGRSKIDAMDSGAWKRGEGTDTGRARMPDSKQGRGGERAARVSAPVSVVSVVAGDNNGQAGNAKKVASPVRKKKSSGQYAAPTNAMDLGQPPQPSLPLHLPAHLRLLQPSYLAKSSGDGTGTGTAPPPGHASPPLTVTSRTSAHSSAQPATTVTTVTGGSTPPAARPVSMSVGDVDEDLVRRLASLNGQKRAQLLSMLDMLEDADPNSSTSAKAVSAASSASLSEASGKPLSRNVAGDNMHGPAQPHPTGAGSMGGTSPLADRRSIAGKEKEVDDAAAEGRVHTEGALESRNANTCDCEDSLILSDALTSSGFQDTTIPLSIRLKLHSNWKNLRYSSLAAIRLVTVEDEEVDLVDFSVKIKHGNNVLAKSSETFRSFGTLLTKKGTKRAAQSEWKFACDGQVPLEVILSGFVSSKQQPSTLELLIWNGTESNNASPVRDVDVFVESTPVFSGCMAERPSDGDAVDSCALTVKAGAVKKSSAISIESGSNPRYLVSTVRKTSNGQVIGGYKPSLCVALNGDSLLRRGATPGNAKPKIKDSEAKQLVGNEGFVQNGTSPLDTKEVAIENSASKNSRAPVISNESTGAPDWLLSLKISQPTGDEKVSGPNLRSENDEMPATRPYSRRAVTPKEPMRPDAVAADLPQAVSSAGEHVETADDVTAKSERRKRRQDAASSSRRSKQEIQEQDMHVRESLDAIKKSDRCNRGRVGQVGLSVVGNVDHASIPQVAEAVSISGRKDAIDFGGGVLNAEIEVQSKMQQRSKRIGQTQNTVHSALASLAGIMSKLNVPPSQAGNVKHVESSVSEAGAGTVVPSRVDRVESQLDASRSLPTSDWSNSRLQEVRSLDAEGLEDELAQSYLESSLCLVPMHPTGSVLVIEVHSTWGDPFYVGLNGVEIFDKDGKLLKCHREIKSVVSNPSDINMLPEYINDPRKIENIFDAVNFTRDDLHVWLAPHGQTVTPPVPHCLAAQITVQFDKKIQLAMIRIWNYNKSRTHCYRGVKHCTLRMDGQPIFDGEIKVAPGLLNSPDECSEVILFTSDIDVLSKINAVDQKSGSHMKDNTEKWLREFNAKKVSNRPRTADKDDITDINGLQSSDSNDVMYRKKKAVTKPSVPYALSENTGSANRPTTAAIRPTEDFNVDTLLAEVPDTKMSFSFSSPKRIASQSYSNNSSRSHFVAKNAPSAVDTVEVSNNKSFNVETRSTVKVDTCRLQAFPGRVLTMEIECTWGDVSYTGLAGVQILCGDSLTPVYLDQACIHASPRDLSEIGCFDDPRTPDKLIDGFVNTTDDYHMWLIPFTKGSRHILEFRLENKRDITALHIWNYNKPGESLFRGARVVSLFVDQAYIGKWELRIAPGCDGVDCKQLVVLEDVHRLNAHVSQLNMSPYAVVDSKAVKYVTPGLKQMYETLEMPRGMLLTFKLLSNYGDEYYVGLDGVEIFDENNRLVNFKKSGHLSTEGFVTAVPYSLADIGIEDSRVPTNLMSAPMHDPTGYTTWLSPLWQCMTAAERMSCVHRVTAVGGTKYHRSLGADEEPHEVTLLKDNVVFVMLDRPVSISLIRIYNYSKMSARGVKDICVELDGRVIYMGALKSSESMMASQHYDPALATATAQSLVFTNSPKIVRQEKDRVNYFGINDQDVLCINERQVMVKSRSMYDRPSISGSVGITSDLANRPTTALSLTG